MRQDYDEYRSGLKDAARIFNIKDKTLRNSEFLVNSENNASSPSQSNWTANLTYFSDESFLIKSDF